MRVTSRVFYYPISFKRFYGDFYRTKVKIVSIQVDGDRFYYCKCPQCGESMIYFDLNEIKKEIGMEIRKHVGD